MISDTSTGTASNSTANQIRGTESVCMYIDDCDDTDYDITQTQCDPWESEKKLLAIWRCECIREKQQYLKTIGKKAFKQKSVLNQKYYPQPAFQRRMMFCNKGRLKA